jgi:hypothetical protein
LPDYVDRGVGDVGAALPAAADDQLDDGAT